jgi:uncharacterized membrane protein
MSRFTDETITAARLISFSDGVFAIAVTLLVFNLKVPQMPTSQVQNQLPGALLAMLPRFTTYLLTFLLIAVYWMFHHRMLNMVVRIDNNFLWMNIWYLLVISFMPFPAALFGSYPNDTVSFVFYVANMIMVCILSMVMLGYASYNTRLINKDIPLALIKYLYFRQFTSVVVFLLSIPLAFYQLRWAQYYLFILFPIHRVTKNYFMKYAQTDQLFGPSVRKVDKVSGAKL